MKYFGFIIGTRSVLQRILLKAVNSKDQCVSKATGKDAQRSIVVVTVACKEENYKVVVTRAQCTVVEFIRKGVTKLFQKD